jgi:hypothetical protein
LVKLGEGSLSSKIILYDFDAGRDYKHTLEMQKLLKNELKSFDVILLLTKGDDTRYEQTLF